MQPLRFFCDFKYGLEIILCFFLQFLFGSYIITKRNKEMDL